MKTRMVLLLALVGISMQGLAATPFRPTEPDFVVAELPTGAAQSRNRFAGRLMQSRRDPRVAEDLAGELLALARTTMQPQLYGRAEKILAPWIARQDVPVSLLLMQADILQQRHEFQQATQLLDRVIATDPREARAHLMRANIYIVMGEFVRARSDCSWLLGSGDPWTGTVCLSQVLGSTGQLDRAAALLDHFVNQRALGVSPEILAWTLGVRADMAVRAGSLMDAQALLKRAVSLMPSSDFLRLSLADVLATQGLAHEAATALETTRPSVGALLRRVEVLGVRDRNPQCQKALAELQERLAVSAQRGERTHLREEARLALDLSQDPTEALTLARDNFAIQKESEDVRILARAATAARDRAAVGQLEEWIHQTGYQDVWVERLLKSERL